MVRVAERYQGGCFPVICTIAAWERVRGGLEGVRVVVREKSRSDKGSLKGRTIVSGVERKEGDT